MRRFAWIFLLSTHVAFAQSPMQDRLDAWMAPLVDAGDLSGVVLVRHRGNVLIHRAYGDQDREAGIGNGLETRFAIGSVSKQFTAAAVLQLHDLGRLDLDSAVENYLGSAMESGRVTLRQLLEHRSGMKRDVPELPSARSLRDVCRHLMAQGPIFPPGSRTEYSNAGYVLLACIVEAVSGRSFEEQIREELLKPLGLSATDFWDGSEALPGQAHGYDPGGPRGELRLTAGEDGRRLLGASGLVTTVGDLILWSRALAEGKVLSARSRREMLEDQGDGRGLGVGVYSRQGHRVIGHDGVSPGYTAFLEWYPDDDLMVAYAGNIRTSAFEFLEDALPSLVFGDELPRVERPDRLEFAKSEGLVGSYRVHAHLVVQIAMKEQGLELRGTGGYFTPLLESAPDRYWYPALYATIEPLWDSSGDIRGLRWRTVHGQDFEIPRIDD